MYKYRSEGLTWLLFFFLLDTSDQNWSERLFMAFPRERLDSMNFRVSDMKEYLISINWEYDSSNWNLNSWLFMVFCKLCKTIFYFFSIPFVHFDGKNCCERIHAFCNFFSHQLGRTIFKFCVRTLQLHEWEFFLFKTTTMLHSVQHHCSIFIGVAAKHVKGHQRKHK